MTKFLSQSQRFNLDPGQYSYCNCGLSDQFPFCDGSHSTTDIVPKKFKVETADSISLCMCGKSLGKPFCDGSHRSL